MNSCAPIVLILLVIIALVGTYFYVNMELYDPNTWTKMQTDPIYPIKILQCHNMQKAFKATDSKIEDGKCFLLFDDNWISSDDYIRSGHD